MRYNGKDKYDITKSHQHLFESAADNDLSSKKYNNKYVSKSINEANGDQKDGSSNIDLTIIGYSCNLYRDDFNAAKVENKNNLIPWNGNENLLIDR